MSAAVGLSPPGPSLMALYARPEAVFFAVAGGAATSSGVFGIAVIFTSSTSNTSMPAGLPGRPL